MKHISLEKLIIGFWFVVRTLIILTLCIGIIYLLEIYDILKEPLTNLSLIDILKLWSWILITYVLSYSWLLNKKTKYEQVERWDVDFRRWYFIWMFIIFCWQFWNLIYLKLGPTEDPIGWIVLFILMLLFTVPEDN